MKKIFFGFTYILLLVIIFVYCITGAFGSNADSSLKGLLSVTSHIGLSLIGFVMIIPAFVFSILALVMEKTLFTFLRNMFSLFASAFIGISIIIACFYGVKYLYVPIILGVSCLTIFVLSLVGVIQNMREDSRAKIAEEHNNIE